MDSIFGSVDDLFLFCKVVEQGSLQKAAHVLNLPQSTVSRRLAALETRLDLRLLEKKGRELTPTEVGKLAFENISSGMEQIESGIESLTEQTNQVSGRVKLSIPHSFFRSFVAPTIEKFLKTYPKVHLDLVLNNDQSKPETDRDLLITFDIEDMDDMIARPIFTARHGFFASQEYVQQCGTISTPTDLAALDWVTIDQKNKLPFFRNGKLHEEHLINPRLIVNDLRAVIDAVSRGLGVASLPLRHAKEATNLVQLLPEYHRGDRQSFLVYKARKYQPNAVRVLIKALLEESAFLDKAITRRKDAN
ncbi:LysR family transcriptional regulator [Photobacterium chitinilyticum]|uniref:LysR family transcriptional regulator n=1 Tax=Photobacterium chitinilyticum TaxID=2485123 RepID=A0A3S3UNV3_9GAMM|nr:LysR family transcriptional regulator [Photobacterium chitinilyticum]RWX56851.1 LysR family transcriptional regulator [Photobacterium chitinilyticum]